MSVSTVNISFQEDFFEKEYEMIFKIGKQIGSTLEISEKDVMKEIKTYREMKQKTK